MKPAQTLWIEVVAALKKDKAATKEVRDSVLLRLQTDGSIRAVDSPNGKVHVRLWQIMPKGEDVLRSLEDWVTEKSVANMKWRVKVYLALLASGLVVLGFRYNHLSRN